jgi:AraC-like DNA-binding protein
MLRTGPKSSRCPPNHCSLKNRCRGDQRNRSPILLCLDPDHRRKIQNSVAHTHALILASCPLQILQRLDQCPRRLVIMDRCTARLACCRRPVAQLQQRIRMRMLGSKRHFHRPRAHGVPVLDHSSELVINQFCDMCKRFVGSTEDLTLVDVTGLLRVGARRLNRIFRRLGWASPMREFRRRMLLEAHEQIRTSPRSIEAISESSGYSDRASFSRAFHRAFGYYPTHLRTPRSHRKGSVHFGHGSPCPQRT